MRTALEMIRIQPEIMISVQGLTVAYGKDVVLEDIDLRLAGRQSTAILGTSGRGKSTLLRCLAGLPPNVPPGTVLIGGEAPSESQKKKDLWFLFQEPVLFQNKSVFQHLELAFELHDHATDRARCDHILRTVGLLTSAAKFPHQLSVGMKARLALAMSFCVPPTILFADEPFASLDSGYRRILNSFLRTLQTESNTTVIWITHEIRDAIEYADRLIVLAGKPARIARDIRLGDSLCVDAIDVDGKRERIYRDLLSLIAEDSSEA